MKSGDLDTRENSAEKKVPVAKYKVSAEHKEAMKKDKRNVKMWKEERGPRGQRDEDEEGPCGDCGGDLLLCRLHGCRTVVTITVTLECLHNFCQVT